MPWPQTKSLALKKIRLNKNKTAPWKLWGESHSAALLYYIEDEYSLFIFYFLQMLFVSLGFSNNDAGQSY